ncbi:MAG: M42 family metallopeptidase [Candidatus Altiarchaeales archaeon]|nr:M42 family metallopeptidase [Candidatus Altiarchaeales archaeon]
MELLEKLCKASGVSGFEDEVRDIMMEEFRKAKCEVSVDKFGNVIAKKGKGKTKIMLAAHMDEVGLLVKHINKEGYINFVKIGGIDDRVLVNKIVKIKTKYHITGGVTGVIGMKPPHLQKEKEGKEVIKYEDMFIDIGVKNQKEAQKLVSIGDPVTFTPEFEILNKEIVCGKALDNRLGCYALISIMQNLPKMNVEVYAVGTTQEEVGLKGARVAAFKINPDYCIALDVTLAGDTPQIKESESSLKLGKGPAITITEASGRGVITHPKIKELIIKAAKKGKIPYQMDVLEGGMTDAAIVYMTREGIPSGAISIPMRYTHGPVGVFNVNDLKNTTKLAVNTLKELAR